VYLASSLSKQREQAGTHELNIVGMGANRQDSVRMAHDDIELLVMRICDYLAARGVSFTSMKATLFQTCKLRR
jgi:hypothetical protein